MYIKEKISKHQYLFNIYFNDNVDSPKTLISYLLLKDYYRDLDISMNEEYDWGYYFIVRRHFLRKMNKLNGGYWKCHYCGKVITIMQERNSKSLNKNAITVDHKLALANGGDLLDTKNMVESCYKCNHEKEDKSYDEFKNSKEICCV
jgi:hypothetical protein